MNLSKVKKTDWLEHRRICVVVTPVVKCPKGNVKMEPGRMMAQACHAVSKLKLHYASIQSDKTAWVKAFLDQPVTTITLKARDQNELRHVMSLAGHKGLPVVSFEDDNEPVYGNKLRHITAVAIGPVNKDQLDNVCDYLPLYT